ncbi:MAG: TonB-dependent receptor [Rhodocyclaceae bacterium]|nr:TonB-dependent receptor [Rhodocyclaceae bacterium]
MIALCMCVSAAAADDAADVVVTATRMPTADPLVSAVVDLIRLQDLRGTLPMIDAAEVLGRVAGINTQNRQNYAQDTQISIRGFGARSAFGMRGIKLYVDDIPATIPDGQGQGAVVPFFTVDTIEVLRGPWAVGYGNAAGGVIAARTRSASAIAGVESRLLMGADATRITTLQIATPTSPSGPANAFNGLVATQRLASDGYRDHSRVQRDQTYAKLVLRLAPTSSIILTANAIDQPDTQDPLGLTRAQFEADPRQVAAVATQFNTRKSIRHRQAGLVWDLRLAALDVKAIVYGGTRAVVQYLATPLSAQLAASSAGGVVDFERTFSGVGLRVAGAQGPLTWALGFDFDRACDERKGFENFLQRVTATELGVRGVLRRDETGRQRANDFFGQANWAIDNTMAVQVGWRHSEIRFEVADRYIRAGNADDSGGVRYSALTPAVGFSKRLNTSLSAYVSASRGFETPTSAELAYRPDQAAGPNFALKPSTSKQWEAGWKWIDKVLSVKAAAFAIRSQDEIVQATAVGGRSTFQNAASTNRRGLELSVDWKPSAKITAIAAVTAIRAEVGQAYVAGGRTVASDSMMTAVPRGNLFAALRWRPAGVRSDGWSGWSVGADVMARSRMAADDTNTAYAAGYAALGMDVRYRWRDVRISSPAASALEIEAFVRSDNLTDAKYVGSVIVNDANLRFFESAPGRRVMLGVAAAVRF